MSDHLPAMDAVMYSLVCHARKIRHEIGRWPSRDKPYLLLDTATLGPFTDASEGHPITLEPETPAMLAYTEYSSTEMFLDSTRREEGSP